jgi:hypothetical protein
MKERSGDGSDHSAFAVIRFHSNAAPSMEEGRDAKRRLSSSSDDREKARSDDLIEREGREGREGKREGRSGRGKNGEREEEGWPRSELPERR